MQPSGRAAQPRVQCPQGFAGEERRSKQMHIDPPQARRRQPAGVDQRQDLVVIARLAAWQGVQQPEDLGTLAQVPASQFPDHERMSDNVSLLEPRRQAGVPAPEVLNPE